MMKIKPKQRAVAMMYTNIPLPNELRKQIDDIIKKGYLGFKTKSEFVKEAVRAKLIEVYKFENLKKGTAKK